MSAARFEGEFIAISGGVGGSKLALGLYRVLEDVQLSIVVNTADDFEHFGLAISPDLDTVVYTLAGRVNTETGWGLAGESWRFMEAVKRLGGEDWFNLGDMDLATHAVRTARLDTGARLTEVTRDIARALGVRARILPATDDKIRTIVETDEGPLSFQRYFVDRRCKPVVKSLRYENAVDAKPSLEVEAAFASPELKAIFLCPSNPFLSIDPVLSIPGLRELMRQSRVPIIAVSPIIGGHAIKGPLAKMMSEFGIPANVQSIATHYGDLLDMLIVDEQDRNIKVDGVATCFTKTLMTTVEDREALAIFALELAEEMWRG